MSERPQHNHSDHLKGISWSLARWCLEFHCRRKSMGGSRQENPWPFEALRLVQLTQVAKLPHGRPCHGALGNSWYSQNLSLAQQGNEVLVNKHDRRGERQSVFKVSEFVLYLQPFLQLLGVGPDGLCLQSTRSSTHGHQPCDANPKATATTARTAVVPMLSEGGNIAKKG